MVSGEQKRFQLGVLFFYLILQGGVLAASVMMAGGNLIYALDDPYIHLAVAESILEGGYGINPGEYASPSSSIIYPYLLAGGLWLGLGTATPLLLTIPAQAFALWLLSGMVWIAAQALFRPSPILSVLLVAPPLALSVNALSLPMTGMEHSLHVMAAMCVMYGIFQVSEQNRRGVALAVIGILLCATIRFEGLALAGLGILALFVFGQRLAALLSLVAVIVLLAVYVQSMTSVGLPPLPSSVLTKSTLAEAATESDVFEFVEGLAGRTYAALQNRWGTVIALAATFMLAMPVLRVGMKRNHIIIVLVGVLAIAAHVSAGQFGWFSRYEVYVVAITLFALFVSLMPLAPVLRPRLTTSLLAVALWVVSVPYFATTISTPPASANIFQQQYQMHRFVQEFYPGKVAVNDLGYVAYANENYVLDLWGLGSEEARLLSRNNEWSAERLLEITSRHGIEYAMIYNDWFPDVPDAWCHAGNLVTKAVTSASDTVSFYVLGDGDRQKMTTALGAFSDTLPEGARVELLACN